MIRRSTPRGDLGPGTSSALSGVPIDRVTAGQIVFRNNLFHRKRHIPADAVPVWELARN